MQGSTQPTGEKNNVIIVPDTEPLPSRPVTPVAQLQENKLVDVTPPATPKKCLSKPMSQQDLVSSDWRS